MTAIIEHEGFYYNLMQFKATQMSQNNTKKNYEEMNESM